MPDVLWRGDAPAVADVWTFTVTGPATGAGMVVIPIGVKAVTVAWANGETADVIAQRLSDTLTNCGIPEFAELSYAYPGIVGGASVVTATGRTAGVPVSVGALTVTPAVGVGVVLAHATTATGPNWASNPGNWSTGTLPGTNANETAVIDGGADLLYGLTAWFSGANALSAVRQRGTVKVGLPQRNNTGGTSYFEYRTRALSIPSGHVYVGDSAAAGTDRFFCSLAAGLSLDVLKTGTPEDDGVPCVDAGSSGAPAALNVFGGSAGWGVSLPTVGTLAAAHVAGQSTLYLVGAVATVNQRAGNVYSRSAVTLLNIQGGTYVQDDGSLGGIVADGGLVRLLHTQVAAIAATFRGSIAGEPPVLDLSGNDRSPRDLSNTSSFTGGAFVLDPYHTAVLTTCGFDMQSLQASDVGRSFTVSRA